MEDAEVLIVSLNIVTDLFHVVLKRLHSRYLLVVSCTNASITGGVVEGSFRLYLMMTFRHSIGIVVLGLIASVVAIVG